MTIGGLKICSRRNSPISMIEVEKASMLDFEIKRRIIRQEDLEDVTGYDRHKNTPTESFAATLKSFSIKDAVFDTIPVLKWFPKYSIKNNLIGDLVAGFTVAIMHIPQGMAYGLLAGLDPIVGLYMAFFPTLVYFIFGTSRHVSTGTFAVVSIMTSKIVATYSSVGAESKGITDINEPSYTNYQVATAVTMVCGIFQIAMCFFRLGALASLLSQSLVSGFTTAAAVHVIVAQSKDLLGVTLPRHKGAFKIIFSIRDIILNLSTSNIYTIFVSIGCISFMILMNEIVKPWAAKRCKFPLPSELMAVIGFTAISYALNLGGSDYKVKEVGKIPTGLPMPEFPPFELLGLVAIDSIAVCIVSVSIVISMALIFAKKDSYEVRANQELLALGLSNIVGSCFSCIPLSVSLSRSIIQHQTGGKTQFASVVSAGLILILLLWIGPLFETLPRATLAGIIIVALKGMILQVGDLKKFYRESVLDVAVWIATFLTVVIIDIDIGLLTGVCVSFIALYIKGFKSYSCLLGQVSNTEIYVDVANHKNVTEVPGVKIFRYYGSVNFATSAGFKKELFDKIGINHKIIRRASLCGNKNDNKNSTLKGSVSYIRDAVEIEGQSEAKSLKCNLNSLIIDLSCMPHIDMSGYRTFLEIRNEMKLLDIKVLLTSPSDCVYDSLRRAVKIGEQSFECFPTIHDAVIYSNKIQQ